MITEALSAIEFDYRDDDDDDDDDDDNNNNNNDNNNNNNIVILIIAVIEKFEVDEQDKFFPFDPFHASGLLFIPPKTSENLFLLLSGSKKETRSMK